MVVARTVMHQCSPSPLAASWTAPLSAAHSTTLMAQLVPVQEAELEQAPQAMGH